MPRGVVNAIGIVRIDGSQNALKWAVEEGATVCISRYAVTIDHPKAGHHSVPFLYPEGVFTAVENCVNLAYDFLRERKVKTYSAGRPPKVNMNQSIQVGRGTAPRKPEPREALLARLERK